MGTAVLFPQDCLPTSKSRHRNNFTDAFSRLQVATDNAFQFFDSHYLYLERAQHSFAPYHGAGPLYRYPYQARNSFTANPLQREVDRRKPKSKRQWDPQVDNTLSAMPSTNVPAISILQRPMHSGAANELATKFLTISDMRNVPIGVSESIVGMKANGTKPCKIVQNVTLDRKKKNELNGKNGVFDPQMGKSKLKGCNLGLPKLQDSVSSLSVNKSIAKDPKGDEGKPQNVMMGGMARPRRSCDDISVLRKELALGGSADQILGHPAENVSYKGAFIRQPPRGHAMGNGAARLRRASTDPQIVDHLGFTRGSAVTRTTSMSLPERWAGPAYSASPAPSSLPLPNFSLLGQKLPSVHSFPVEQRHNSNVTKPVDLGSGSTSPDSHHAEGELDVAFATMSLRRMLKLDQP